MKDKRNLTEKLKETAELHKKFTLKAAYISELFKDMRSILDIFTGNFYSN